MSKKKKNAGNVPTLSGYSTALFSTWYFWHEPGILFDCGDGVNSGLLQKSGKVKHVFVSHADRDHMSGLLQFNQLNARPSLKIYYPKDCGSFLHLADFSRNFDPHVDGTQWIPMEDGMEVQIREDLVVRALRNQHVQSKEGEKSLSYIAESISRKLKPELLGTPGPEIAALRKEQGDEAISELSRTTQLIYSGDTPIEHDGRYQDAEILIHEATFLTAGEIDPDNPHRNKHSSLDQVMVMVAESNVQRLVLGHFSSRYSHEQIDEAIQMQCELNGIEIPVHRVLPGVLSRDILGESIRVKPNR